MFDNSICGLISLLFCQVTKLSEASFMLEDISEVWFKLGKEAVEAGTRVATVHNVDRINT